jgi:Protein of unknown function (DUF3108)
MPSVCAGKGGKLRLVIPVFGLFILSCVLVAARDLPFPVGEELTYKITWNGIPVARSQAVTQMDTFEGREVLAIRISTKTYPFFNHIFKVDDFHESLMDPETLLPIRYLHNLNEGSFRAHEATSFDFDALKAHYVHQVTGEKKTYDIKPGMRDILSFMYFMRSELLEENSESKYLVLSDHKIYDLIIKAGEIEKIELPRYDRKIPSLEMRPEAMFDGLFVRAGKATVWVSRDTRRLLTFMKVSVPFGRVRTTLQEVNGPGEDFWITEKKDGDETDK